MVYLSKKHGLGPIIPKCFYCNKDKNEIVLLGNLADRLARENDDYLPHSTCLDNEPCDECKEFMEKGIIIISTRNGESGQNPYRTGGFFVVKDDLITRICNDPHLTENILKKRVIFMEDATLHAIGICTKDGNPWPKDTLRRNHEESNLD